MINRKAKRHSPPPFQTTIATIDNKLTDSFSKWSKVLQLISPPNKKRRAIALIGHQQESWSSDDDSDEEEEEDELSDSDDDIQKVTIPPVLKRERSLDQLNPQRILNRRAMYIPNPSSNTTHAADGPKDPWHQWTLYRATHQKLRQNSLPLLEMVHLRKMLVILQPLEDDLRMNNNTKRIIIPKKEKLNVVESEDEEDDIPLGTLLNKRPITTTTTNKLTIRNKTISYRRHSPPASITSPFYNNMNYYYQPPPQCFYHNNRSFPVQFM